MYQKNNIYNNASKENSFSGQHKNQTPVPPNDK